MWNFKIKNRTIFIKKYEHSRNLVQYTYKNFDAKDKAIRFLDRQREFPHSNIMFLSFADDFRIFCGDLGNDVTDEMLIRVFGKYPSFQRAKVVRDKRTNKTKGFGFVSFKDPQDFIKAMKEMNGKSSNEMKSLFLFLVFLENKTFIVHR